MGMLGSRGKLHQTAHDRPKAAGGASPADHPRNDGHRWRGCRCAKYKMIRDLGTLLESRVSGGHSPLGLIDFASPLTASGFLFPAWSWGGFALSLTGCGLIVAYPKLGFLGLTTMALVANILHPGDRQAPLGWQAVDTHLGAISHGPVSALREYLAAQDIQALAVASPARIVVFPESVVPRWTMSTDLFWKPTIDTLRQNGKVVVIGALIPESLALSNTDIHAAIELLRTAHEAQPIPRQAEPYPYRNVAIIRGTQSGIFFQRVPVPVSVWKPFSRGGAPLENGFHTE